MALSDDWALNAIMWLVGEWITEILSYWGIYGLIGMLTFWDVNVMIQQSVFDIFLPAGLKDWSGFKDDMSNIGEESSTWGLSNM